MGGGELPTSLVTEFFHPVATVKYISAPRQWRIVGWGSGHAFMRGCVCQCAGDSGRTTHLSTRFPLRWARGWGLPLCAITIVVLRRGYSYPAAPSVSQTVSVCVVNGVTCLFGSDPPLFFYLLCFSDSLWTSSLLLLPIAYLPSILLYDNKSMWVNSDFSQIQQDNWILPHSFLITQKSN